MSDSYKKNPVLKERDGWKRLSNKRIRKSYRVGNGKMYKKVGTRHGMYERVSFVPKKTVISNWEHGFYWSFKKSLTLQEQLDQWERHYLRK